ncbi:hypothetical protein BDV25DRAFT_129397 [Aspergillus avenaceus]|uniref:Fungal-type protein kinase domain-containing protein n=1 Tax=Aspergillus avenaceus TaxID=36643 RepID=A0A5N6TWL1_ASPAV|nr:hypothetical protein BDV25DRAFT_129397 [Aspergillus avenaceus]
MANRISLMSYLQNPLPAIPINPHADPGHNTRNRLYRASDIRTISRWHGFNLAAIRQAYDNVLFQANMPSDPVPSSPPRMITSENPLKAAIQEYVVPRIRRALQIAFGHLATNNQMAMLTPISFGVGESASIIDAFKPDTAYFAVDLPAGTGPNRAPGDIKPSWKWSTALATQHRPALHTEFKQALSQVNWYMKQHKARYGFLLTDRELVAIRRLDDHGNLELAEPIPFTRGGTTAQPQLTVLLALFYIGMLAAQDTGAGRWNM